MKRNFALFLLFLLIAGCTGETSKTATSGIENQTEPLPAVENQTIVPEPSLNVSSEVKKEPVITPEAKVLFAKNSKLNSYTYFYYGPPNDALGISYAFFGNRSRVALTKSSRLSDGNYYDFVYLNLSSKTAAAYCEAVDCSVKGPLDVDFSTYILPTPLDFVNSVSSAGIKSSELIEGRKVAVVPYSNKEGVNGTMWVEMTYGVPLKVIINSTKYEFREAFFNTLVEADVMPKN